jgi:hypothetical protein
MFRPTNPSSGLSKVHTLNEKSEALIVDIKETEHEVNADKTKYMTMSRNQSE